MELRYQHRDRQVDADLADLHAHGALCRAILVGEDGNAIAVLMADGEFDNFLETGTPMTTTRLCGLVQSACFSRSSQP